MGRKPKEKTEVIKEEIKKQSEYQIEHYPDHKLYYVLHKGKYLGISIATDSFFYSDSAYMSPIFNTEKQARDFIKMHKSRKEVKKIIIEVE